MVQIRHRSRHHSPAVRVDRLTKLIRDSIPDWYSRAACGLADPAIFWADEWQTDPTKNNVHGSWSKDAERICDTCPVKRECVQYVRDENVKDGAVWAGRPRKPPSNTATPYPQIRYARSAEHRGSGEGSGPDWGTPLLPDPRVTAEIDDLLARRDELLARVRGERA